MVLESEQYKTVTELELNMGQKLGWPRDPGALHALAGGPEAVTVPLTDFYILSTLDGVTEHYF